MTQFKIFLVLSITLLCSIANAQTPTFTTSGELCDGKTITFSTPFEPPIGTTISLHWNFGTGNPADTLLQTTEPFTPAPFTFSQARGYFVILTVTSNNGTKYIGSREVFINPTPEDSIELSVPCFPGSVVFKDFSNVSDGSITSRIWSISGGTSTDQTFTFEPGMQGTYNVQLDVTSDRGCRATSTANFDYTAAPALVFIPSGPVSTCIGDSATLEVSGASSYIWKNGTLQPIIKVGNPGHYTVTGYTGNMCSTTDSIEVIYVPNPAANAGDDQTIKLGEKITLLGSGGSTYSWAPVDFLSDAFIANPIANPNNTTTYVLTVLDQNGCTDKDTITISVDTETTIPIHNMLTPNGDGFNDKWDLSSVPQIENASVHVFNRWGWEVYKSEDYKNDWQGTFNGEPLPDGSYVYVIQFADPNFETIRGVLEILSNTQK